MTKEKTGYEKVSVSDIRQALLMTGMNPRDGFLENTKSVLVERLLELQAAKCEPTEARFVPTTGDEEAEVNFDDAVEDEDTTAYTPCSKEEAIKLLPSYGSELWHGYVMKQFRDDELMDGAPTCDGCRRVVEQLIGPICSISITNSVAPSTTNNGTATVAVGVDIFVTIEEHPLTGQRVFIEDIADVNKDNCDAPYHKYPSATCMTRAEGRVYRKLLRLRNTITAEEASETAETSDGCDWTVDEPITNSQLSTMDMMCSRLNVSARDFINSGSIVYDSILHVKKSTAARMLKELNKIQKSDKPKPAGIDTYVPDWREEKEGDK